MPAFLQVSPDKLPEDLKCVQYDNFPDAQVCASEVSDAYATFPPVSTCFTLEAEPTQETTYFCGKPYEIQQLIREIAVREGTSL